MPITTDDKEKLNFGVLRDFLLHWCKLLQPAHGGAGYSIILEVAATSGEPYVYSTMQSHQGFNLQQSVQFVGRSRGVFNRIKCVNWLTVLNDSILNELGGLSLARTTLEPDCLIHPYPGGVVIQAGVLPALGDTYNDNIPAAYKKVANFTKPVRFENYRSSLFKVFEPLDSKEESLKWVRRFD